MDVPGIAELECPELALWKALAVHLPKDFPLGGPHKARHDLARRLLIGDGGLRPPTPIQDVARILGHAGNDPRITAGVYGAPSEEDLRSPGGNTGPVMRR